MLDKPLECLFAGFNAVLKQAGINVKITHSAQDLKNIKFPTVVFSWGGSDSGLSPNPNVRDCRYIESELYFTSAITVYGQDSLSCVNILLNLMYGSRSDIFTQAVLAKAKELDISQPSINEWSALEQNDNTLEDNKFLFTANIGLKWGCVPSYDQGKIPALGDTYRQDVDIVFNEDQGNFSFTDDKIAIRFNSVTKVFSLTSPSAATALFVNGREYPLTSIQGQPLPLNSAPVTETEDIVTATNRTKTINVQFADKMWLFTDKITQDLNITISGNKRVISRTITASKLPTAKF